MKNRHLLQVVMERKGQVEITVKGSSMKPLLKENDCITIRKQERYGIGDIVVYFYKNEGLLVHRLLRIGSRLYCKGDNAFRIEDIEEDDIFGKVILVNGNPIYEWPAWKIQLSYEIGRLFKAKGYNIQATMQSNIYKVYADVALSNAIGQKYYLDLQVIENNYFPNIIERELASVLAEPRTILETVEKLQSSNNWPKFDLRFEIEKIICCLVLDGIVVPL